MTVVVDATVPLQWVLQEQDTDAALALWDRWQESDERVVVPPLFKSEVTNVLYQMVRQDSLGPADATDLLGFLLSSVATVEHPSLYHSALSLASELALGSANDGVYLALAESEECDMWTADRRLYWSVRERLSYVHSVGELA